MKLFITLCVISLITYADVIKIKDKFYAYNENCYGNSMELSFYEVQGIANNNDEINVFIADRYQKCYHKEKLYVSDGYARDINNNSICSEKQFKNDDCPITPALTKKNITKIILKEIN